MDDNKTGFQKFDDLPVTQQEKDLIAYHAEVRAGKFDAQPGVEDKPSLQNDGRRIANWEKGAKARQSSTGTLTLTQLALAEIYKDAIEKNLEKFKNRYNSTHVDNKISLALTINNRIFDSVDSRGTVAQAAVAIEIRENGVGRILMNKVYNFTHKRQIMDEGEWKLTLYKEILYELVGGCITLAILTNPENNIQYGDQEQSKTGKQDDTSGDSPITGTGKV